jgi:TatA/E family protein of Tat protein translocase
MGLDNPLHIAFLVVILLLVFGARRLPEIGRSLGGGMREFKDAVTGSSHQSSQQPQQPGLNAAQQQPQAAPAPPPPAPVAVAEPAPVAAQPDPVESQPRS